MAEWRNRMTQQSLHRPEEYNDIDVPCCTNEGRPLRSLELYVAVNTDASIKVGTCEHCVLQEEGRPARAWDADGDTELDFDRDQYFALLARLGIVMTERQAYVCP